MGIEPTLSAWEASRETSIYAGLRAIRLTRSPGFGLAFPCFAELR